MRFLFKVCRYDLDDLDTAWLTRTNEDLSTCGEAEIHEYAMEKFVEEVENKCHEQLQGKIKSVEGRCNVRLISLSFSVSLLSL